VDPVARTVSIQTQSAKVTGCKPVKEQAIRPTCVAYRLNWVGFNTCRLKSALKEISSRATDLAVGLYVKSSSCTLVKS